MRPAGMPILPAMFWFALAPGVLVPLVYAPGVDGASSLVASCGLTSRRFACHARLGAQTRSRELRGGALDYQPLTNH